ncbi:uncharacterized protein LOC113282958 [Papaver somniferum]|uniref:uncharacterized protein LOC113282958 n=1 Tax=Papaver somniferum TaxID=3469 RepID=UPI000E6F946D|nr:uncharacterized protein LOC113282958 [Papaver somniferum]
MEMEMEMEVEETRLGQNEDAEQNEDALKKNDGNENTSPEIMLEKGNNFVEEISPNEKNKEEIPLITQMEMEIEVKETQLGNEDAEQVAATSKTNDGNENTPMEIMLEKSNNFVEEISLNEKNKEEEMEIEVKETQLGQNEDAAPKKSDGNENTQLEIMLEKGYNFVEEISLNEKNKEEIPLITQVSDTKEEISGDTNDSQISTESSNKKKIKRRWTCEEKRDRKNYFSNQGKVVSETSKFIREEKKVKINGTSKKCSSNGGAVVRVREVITRTDKKLLVLDLNGLLADLSNDLGRKARTKRPYCDEFLKFCFERFHVGVWSSRKMSNVINVVNFLMGDMKENLLFCWDVSHCTETGFRVLGDWYKPLVLKELKKLWNKHEPNLPWQKGVFNESNTLLLDDSPYKALCNPLYTAIFPSSYTREAPNDNSLGPGGDLWVYLEGLVLAGNVQQYVEQHPFGQPAITSRNPKWGFYLEVFNAVVRKMSQMEFLEYL